MRPVISSVKHYVQISLSTVSASTALTTTLIQGVELGNVSAGSSTEVPAGASIKAIFVEIWIRSTELTPGTVLVSLVKTPTNQGMTFTESVALHTYDNKKNVLYHTQGLTNENSTGAIPFMRGWFKIPKGKQRFGLGDKLILQIASQAAIDNVICGFATYKEYT